MEVNHQYSTVLYDSDPTKFTKIIKLKYGTVSVKTQISFNILLYFNLELDNIMQ